MSSDPKTVVRGFVEAAFVQHDADAMARYTDNDELKQAAARFGAAFPDIELTVEHLVAEGDIVAVRVTGRATHLGDFQGIAPTHRRWEATGSAWYRVEGDKISDFWVNWDTLSILRQIGALG